MKCEYPETNNFLARHFWACQMQKLGHLGPENIEFNQFGQRVYEADVLVQILILFYTFYNLHTIIFLSIG